MLIETLLIKLKELEQSEIEADASEYLPEGEEAISYPASVRTLLVDIVALADDVLITPEGKPNGRAIETLKCHGFRVGPGEQDSFGWLTGVIFTQKGKVVFG